MRIATIVEDGAPAAALVRDRRVLPLQIPGAGLDSLRAIAAGGGAVLATIRDWADTQPEAAYRSMENVELGPAVPHPGAIYTIGLNYGAPGAAAPGAAAPTSAPGAHPERPLVYAKLPSSVSGHGAVVSWDRSLTANVDAEVELGVVIGAPATAVEVDAAMAHIFGYTCVNDMSSRDPWLDGDQWLLGKSLAGFCPIGPWVVTRDELKPEDVRLGCTVNGAPIQDGSTAQMRHGIPELIAYLSRHVTLGPGDVIATGTPARLLAPPGPDRHLERGDVVTAWIEGIGELTTTID
jgi:2-keto-4-pentenoate hydratase/2-oxohepta-3-ene-1,7-dioic acid hydratase in catechol pathway